MQKDDVEKYRVCYFPWTHIGLGWNKFSVCCVSPDEDFGEIIGFLPTEDIQQTFNHANYQKLRGFLTNPSGESPNVCTNCGVGANSSSISGFRSRQLSHLKRIEDAGQKERARENLERALDSIYSKEIVVSHNPVIATITCGSACNIKCKFCYNCHMNYYPEASDLLNVVDQIHETLIEATLTGGEPIVTKAGRALLEEFATGKYKFAVSLFTNAQYADFKLYKPVNLVRVSISADGATKKVYEYVRKGGDFKDLIRNVKKFIEMKKEKPYLDITLNFTVSSDNYVDIPEAVKLYEGLGLRTGFQPVLREKDDPQNFAERPDLYDDVLKKVSEGIELSASAYTQGRLKQIEQLVLRKIEENHC